MASIPSNHYKLVGDVINTLVLVGSLAYLLVAVRFTLPGAEGVVDEHWKKDGFCIQNSDVPYWSSFDTCLYVDVVFSVIIGIMYLSWKDVPGMEVSSSSVPSLIVSTLGHGIAHGGMALKLRDGSYQQQQQLPDVPLWQKLAMCGIFWFPLLKASLPKMNSHHVVAISAIAMYGSGFVKKELGFPYVQTIVVSAFQASQLMLTPEEKSIREYMMSSLPIVPTIVVAWSEMLFCDSFFRSIGGHLLYDASIVLSFTVYYLESYLFSTKSRSKNLTKTKTA